MSEFPRIDPDHVLTQAARATNAYSEEHGLEATLKWLGLDIPPEELMYLAEQRAIRCVAELAGYNMGFNPIHDEEVARGIVGSHEWTATRPLLISAYMDGIAIGLRAQQLKDSQK